MCRYEYIDIARISVNLLFINGRIVVHQIVNQHLWSDLRAVDSKFGEVGERIVHSGGRVLCQWPCSWPCLCIGVNGQRTKRFYVPVTKINTRMTSSSIVYQNSLVRWENITTHSCTGDRGQGTVMLRALFCYPFLLNSLDSASKQLSKPPLQVTATVTVVYI